MASLPPRRAARYTNAKSGGDDLASAWNVLRHGVIGYQVTMHHVLIVNELLDSLVESDRPKFVPVHNHAAIAVALQHARRHLDRHANLHILAIDVG